MRQIQRRWLEHGKRARVGQRGDMHDERIERRPALGTIDPRNGSIAVGPRGQAVDRFRGHGDQTTLAQKFRGLLQTPFVRYKRFRSVFAAHACALYAALTQSQEEVT